MGMMSMMSGPLQTRKRKERGRRGTKQHYKFLSNFEDEIIFASLTNPIVEIFLAVAV